MDFAAAAVALRMDSEEPEQSRQGPRCFTYSQGFQLTGLFVACASLVSSIALVQLLGAKSSESCSFASRFLTLQRGHWHPRIDASRYIFSEDVTDVRSDATVYKVKTRISGREANLRFTAGSNATDLKQVFDTDVLHENISAYVHQVGTGLQLCDVSGAYVPYNYEYIATEKGPLEPDDAALFGNRCISDSSSISENSSELDWTPLPHPRFYLPAYKFIGDPMVGGNAVVYRVEDGESGQSLALKVAHCHEDACCLGQEFEQMRAVADIPEIPRVHSVGRGLGSVFCDSWVDYYYEFLIMDWFGQSVPEASKDKVVNLRWIFEELPGLLFPILVKIHEKGIIHCDVTLKNILLDPAAPANIKLTDFGLSETSGTQVGMKKWMFSPLSIENDAEIEITPSYDFEMFGWVLAKVAFNVKSKQLLGRALGYLEHVWQSQGKFDYGDRVVLVLSGQVTLRENLGKCKIDGHEFSDQNFETFKRHCESCVNRLSANSD